MVPVVSLKMKVTLSFESLELLFHSTRLHIPEDPTSSSHRLENPEVKVKCTLVQELRLCTGRAAHRGSRGIALLFRDHGTRRG